MSAFLAVLGRDLRLAIRRGFDLLQPLYFAVLVCLLTTLAVGPAIVDLPIMRSECWRSCWPWMGCSGQMPMTAAWNS